MGGKGDIDIDITGGADPRDDYARVSDALPIEWVTFGDGAGDVELMVFGNWVNDGGPPWYYTFTTLTMSDYDYFGFSLYLFFQTKVGSIGALATDGDYFLDISANRVYIYGLTGSAPTADGYCHMAPEQIEWETTGPISMYEDRADLIGFFDPDITDDNGGYLGRTLPNHMGHFNWGDGNVIGAFYGEYPGGANPPLHPGMYHSSDGGQTFDQVDVSGDYLNQTLRSTSAEPTMVGSAAGRGHVAGRYAGFIPMLGGPSVYVTTFGDRVFITNDKGASWDVWRMKDLINDQNSPNNTFGTMRCIARDPKVISGDIIKAATAATRWYGFVLGNNPGGSGAGDGWPADLVHVRSSGISLNPLPPPTWINPKVDKIADAVSDRSARFMIATYDDSTDTEYIQGWHHAGANGYSVTKKVPGVIVNTYRWRDRFPTETMGVDWTMITCYTPDMVNCYAIMSRAHQIHGGELEFWWWQSNDFGVTWQRVGQMHSPTQTDWSFHWFLLLDELNPPQKILAQGFYGNYPGGRAVVWKLSEDGGVTWTDIGSQKTLHSSITDRWKYGSVDFPCGMMPTWAVAQRKDEFHIYMGDHGIDPDNFGGVPCNDSNVDYYGRGAYMEYTIAGTTLTENVICSAEAGFIIRAQHINELRQKLQQLNATVQARGTTPTNFGIDVSDIPTVAQNKTQVRADHYGFLRREFETQIRPIVSTAPGGSWVYTDEGVDLTDPEYDMPTPIADGPDGVSIRTLLGMRKIIQSLYLNGWFCACYSYCPCQTDITISGGGSKK